MSELRWRQARGWVCLIVVTGLVPACGKKGPPLAPLPRVPAAVGEFAAVRRGDTVLVSFVAPTTNVSGDAPADVAAVELYAVTGATAPTFTAGPLPADVTLWSTTRVRRPPPPLPPAEAATVPPIPREPGVVDQGERVTVTDVLTAALRLPVASASPSLPTPDLSPQRLSPPLVYVPDTLGVRRHYVAVAVSRGGRRSAWSPAKSVPVAEGPSPPRAPTLTHDSTTLTLAWTPGPGAHLGEVASPDGLLPSRPLGPPVPATRYNVYPAAAGGGTGDVATAGAPLNGAPLAAPPWSTPGVVFGEERCYAVRALDTAEGADVEGPASPPACVTPVDTFPPAAPTRLDAVGGVGVVSLIWDRVEEPDVVGYLVFRGPVDGTPTQLLTPAPIVASSFEDRAVTPGTRYAYVVVAIDSATPPNRSGPSNRADGQARQ